VDGNDQISSDEPTAGSQQSSKKGGGDPKGWVGHDPEGTTGQRQIGGVGADHGDGHAIEPRPEELGPTAVELHGHDSGPGGDEGRGDRPRAGTDVEHEVVRIDTSGGDEALGVPVSELVPSPP
jgi:hypothetical protein